MGTCIYTVGHSNHTLERFLELLRQHGIQVVVDVRSSPFSRYATWFNREPLSQALTGAGIKYVFMGDAIGGRPDSPEFYDEDGHVLYGSLSQSPAFQQGIARLLTGSRDYRVAIMCGEENPADCHRNLLIGRVLTGKDVEVKHIRGDGRINSASDLEGAKLTLFDEGVESEWKSTRSVSPRSPQRSSSDS